MLVVPTFLSGILDEAVLIEQPPLYDTDASAVVLLETPDLYMKLFTIFVILPLYESRTLIYDGTVSTINYFEIVAL